METDKIRKAWEEAYKCLVGYISSEVSFEDACCMFFEFGWNAAIGRNSVIKWQTGKPTMRGSYLIQTKDDGFQLDVWSTFVESWSLYYNSDVVAWCKLSDIEPYKE